jgi:CheY-like chemotaxis protein
MTVSDTGRGMTREVLDRIFEPFFTTKAPGEGTGLGLAVVHGVMQAHDGAVMVRSTPGEGTVFELYFPAHAPHAAPAVIHDESPLPAGKGERVVLIDDEESILQVGRIMLTQLGYRVEACDDSALMLERLRERPQEVDIVVSDVSMPGMSGPELADHLSKLRPGLPIILMTGYDATLSAERLRKIGVREVLALLGARTRVGGAPRARSGPGERLRHRALGVAFAVPKKRRFAASGEGSRLRRSTRTDSSSGCRPQSTRLVRARARAAARSPTRIGLLT